MEKQGLPYTTWPPVLVSWEDARRGLEEQLRFTPEERVLYKQQFMRWSGTADREWIINNFGAMPTMTPESFLRVQEICDTHLPGIDVLAGDLVDALQSEAVAALYDGRAVHAPYTTVGAPGSDPNRKVFYGTGEGNQGWAVSVGFTWDEVPHLQALNLELSKLVEARDREVAAFLWPKKSK